MDRRNMIGLGLAAAAFSKQALADTVMPGDGSVPSDPKEIVTLWPGTPPGGAGVHLPNRIQNRDPGAAPVDRYIDQVGNPSMIVFRPDKPDGSAIIVAPGGGYSREMMDFEGTDVARRFNAAGVTVFVLRYRLPGEGWAMRSDVPLQDSQRAMRLVRANAAKYALDPARIGFMGFSAGGHVACSIATRFAAKVYAPVDSADSVDARPSFSVPIYPVVTMGDGRHAGSRDKLLGENPSAERSTPIPAKSPFRPMRRPPGCAWRPMTRWCRRSPMPWPISPLCAPPISRPRSTSSRLAAMAMASARRWASPPRPGPICCCIGAPATDFSKELFKRGLHGSQNTSSNVVVLFIDTWQLRQRRNAITWLPSGI